MKTNTNTTQTVKEITYDGKFPGEHGKPFEVELRAEDMGKGIKQLIEEGKLGASTTTALTMDHIKRWIIDSPMRLSAEETKRLTREYLLLHNVASSDVHLSSLGCDEITNETMFIQIDDLDPTLIKHTDTEIEFLKEGALQYIDGGKRAMEIFADFIENIKPNTENEKL